MKCENGKIKELEIAYIGGGSRGWAWTFMTDLALEPSLSGTIRLYDIDMKAAKQNAVIGNQISGKEEAVGKWKYVVKESLGEALEGADFVVISILPGTFEEMESDVHLPETLGIYQSVGDTTGPGGIIRAMRTIPMFVEIAKAIRQYAPDAWVINYTNPMAICVKTLYEVFPDIKAYGCCHEVFGTQKILRSIYEQEFGVELSSRKEVMVNVLGINHFTWFDRASCRGLDMFPLYSKFVEYHFETGYEEKDGNWMNNTFTCANRVKFDLFRKYGLIAAAGDRHLAEFMPGDQYLRNPEIVKKWKFGLTKVSYRKEDLKKRLERSDRLAVGKESMALEPTGEEGIVLIKALCGLERVISNVNFPNKYRQIENMPEKTIVETNVVFSQNSVQPISAGRIPDNMEKLFAPHIENQETIMEAGLNKDREYVYRAFEKDPLIAGRAGIAEIKRLADKMLENTKSYLPTGW